MLEIHPQPQRHRDIGVRIRDRQIHAGRLGRQAFSIDEILAVRRVLDSIVLEGLLRTEVETVFECIRYYDTPDAWASRLNQPKVGDLEADESLITAALELMPHGNGEIFETELVRAVRFSRPA